MEATKVFSRLLDAYVNPNIRIVVMKGGTRSGKTWSTLQLLDYIGRKSKSPRLISVVSESMPHLKKGAIRDFKNILEKEEVFDQKKFNETDKIYSYNKGKIEFFSADQPSKVHGPARQILYINECINIEWEVYRQLSVRTTEKIILDYNPAWEFWVDTKLLHRKDVTVVHSTYLDNRMLSQMQVNEIESNRETDPEWFSTYGLGLLGTKKGLVIKNWDIVESVPPRSEWKKAFIGIDFGWSAPTAIMLVVLSQGEVYIDQICYEKNLDNPDIADKILKSGYGDLECICDKAEPKSISEIKNKGVNAVPSDNKDIKLGIKVMNRYKKHYTSRSLGSIAENRKYRYPQDSEGNYDETTPIDNNNHAKDAERYVFLNRLSDSIPTFDIRIN